MNTGASASRYGTGEGELAPVCAALLGTGENLGSTAGPVAKSGLFGHRNFDFCESRCIEPRSAVGGQLFNRPSKDGRTLPRAEPSVGCKALECMARRASCWEGERTFSKRQATAEPVFGIGGTALGFGQFRPCVIEAFQGERLLICSPRILAAMVKPINYAESA